MTQITQHFIVIGNPISHSKSPDIHQKFAEQVDLKIQYSRQYCPDDADSFAAVVTAFFNGGGIGANVTVPFKQIAYELCAKQGKLSTHASVAGAVNTLMMQDGQLYGDNTDGQGLVNHMTKMGWQIEGANIAIIGAGGAARGVILPLIQAGAAFITIANRTVSKAKALVADLQKSADLQSICKSVTSDTLTAPATLMSSHIDELLGHFDIIINATSTGLSGDELPLAPSLRCDYAYDMMYGRQLPFLRHFAAVDAATSNGYGMLISQAALSFTLWTTKQVDTTTILD